MRLTQKISWLWRRLSVMGPAEIASRVGDQLYLFKLRRRHRLPPADLPQEPPGSSRQREFRVAAIEFDLARLGGDMPMLLEGGLKYGGGDWQFDEGAATWHTEHTSLRQWPQSFFNAINYRPGNEVGDARRTWEPARLQQLIPLALRTDEGALTEAESALALQMIERQLVSWWTHNPMLHGIHYVSAMECGLRCLSLSHMASLLEDRGRLSAAVRAIVLTTLVQHADFIRKRISSHSSAGNHTLAECAGLLYVSLLVPERSTSAQDEAFAVKLFTHEFARQVDVDGGGLEQATWYHRFNVELAECVAGTLAAHDRPVPAELEAALKRGSAFLSVITTPAGDTLRLGDADDGYALSPYHLGKWRNSMPPGQVHSFRKHGLTSIRYAGWHVLAQHGPLGMPPSCGHGHADALSLIALVDDIEVLSDSGTGAYSGECAGHRDHFRSSAAHNTVQVGEGDFARAISPFMWVEPYDCQLLRLEESASGVELSMRLSVDRAGAAFTVCRYVRVAQNGLSVADRITAGQSSKAVQRWHVPLPLETNDSGRVLTTDPIKLVLHMPDADPGTVTTERAHMSPGYGELRGVNVVAQSADTEPASSDGTWLYMTLTKAPEAPNGALQEAVLEIAKIKTRAEEFFT